jgi:hypothetical protein
MVRHQRSLGHTIYTESFISTTNLPRFILMLYFRSLLATSRTADGKEFESQYGQVFSLLHVVQTGSGAHTASNPKCTRALSREIKQPKREADHSPPNSAKVKNTWIYTSIILYVFMA